jgi:hypothetical protein
MQATCGPDQARPASARGASEKRTAASQPVVAIPSNAKISPGSRAAAVFNPNTRIDAACAQKKRIGLSRNGRRRKRGTIRSPRSTISCEMAACRPSSGSVSGALRKSGAR